MNQRDGNAAHAHPDETVRDARQSVLGSDNAAPGIGSNPTLECRTVYESRCTTTYHEREVEDDVVECEMVQEEKCEEITQGYTTESRCRNFPKKVCTKTKKSVKKYSPETLCKKVPRELCGPA